MKFFINCYSVQFHVGSRLLFSNVLKTAIPRMTSTHADRLISWKFVIANKFSTMNRNTKFFIFLWRRFPGICILIIVHELTDWNKRNFCTGNENYVYIFFSFSKEMLNCRCHCRKLWNINKTNLDVNDEEKDRQQDGQQFFVGQHVVVWFTIFPRILRLCRSVNSHWPLKSLNRWSLREFR